MKRSLVLTILAVSVMSSGIALADPPVTFSKTSVTVKPNIFGDKGTFYLDVGTKIKVSRQFPKGTMLKCKTFCEVKDEKTVDESIILGADLDSLEPGLTKKVSTTPFITEGLEARPKMCEISFQAKQLFQDSATILGTFCWTKGKITEGTCPGNPFLAPPKVPYYQQ